ncbi:hypothetical protein BX616_001488 [Lobosporangium transversale]|uniref:Galactose mutarotase-like domain-containing protein n=1 Tax=Lobosporangium transversale TaxID=64571 RepID=A0A1Y2GHT5_9FUNG|nr:galactose mutarotase-like domain-containing protein [Lobosporangium transversale]KAF9917280.1 hypothetical protein BX616_001488 [Lobosporangium transversale]ORZ11291.1 galactose mutarotase-like domain-containing protein [Lobosporangium transversale]|eukprot:XP_021879606.1 galactose mutarotase-like domain-containing protein [Lobosporangium transversale]
MPVKTITLSTNPVLVQQHVLSISLKDNDFNNDSNKTRALSATILTYGATLTHFIVPDRWNQPQDVVLGFDHWQDYLAQSEPGALNPYFGAIIGRTASRIAHASFNLQNSYERTREAEVAVETAAETAAVNAPLADGSVVSERNSGSGSSAIPQKTSTFSTFPSTDISTHTLKVSNGKDCHHGGPLGFDKQHWATISVKNEDEEKDSDGVLAVSVTLQLISPHGQNGYPGRLVTDVKYQLNSSGELIIEYRAQLQKKGSDNSNDLDLHSTIVNLTNHTYWNLDGVLNPVEDQAQGLLPSAMVIDADAATTTIGNPNNSSQAHTRTTITPTITNRLSVKDHTLWLNTSNVIELGDPHPVPTGKIIHLQEANDRDSLLIFSMNIAKAGQKKLEPGLNGIQGGYGYDHVYALGDDGPPSSLFSSPSSSISTLDGSIIARYNKIGIQGYLPSTPHVATLTSSRTGIRLDLFTSEPALVLYSAGYLDSSLLPRTKSQSFDLLDSSSTTFFSSPTATSQQRSSGSNINNSEDQDSYSRNPVKSVSIVAEMSKFSGLCLEPIRYPDAIHHPDWANMVILHHDQIYRQKSIYKFSIEP